MMQTEIIRNGKILNDNTVGLSLAKTKYEQI